MTDDLALAAEAYDDSLDIAVVGMAGRFPGAPDVAAFWRNLRDGVCSVTFYDDDELAAAGVDPALYRDPRFVNAAAVLPGAEEFDADFFAYSPREAEIMDPQHRVLLECAWEALERAGCDPERHDGLIGVYAGGGAYGYLLFHVAPHAEIISAVGTKQVEIANSNDFLATRLSYKLGLEGPSVNVQSACSTSLVAVALACQELLAFQCDTALAGGVAIDVANTHGYLYQEDGTLSADGYCRAFDAAASGTVGGSGAGLVVLKRLRDAVEGADHIHAVIKGAAVNNDGSQRAGFTAPRQDGQARAIATALATAGVEPRTISFVEGHGTATALGDPIEVAALKTAFAAGTPDRGFCALGSVKTNIGHLDAAAGIAGLVKGVLAVEHGQIPATLHFEEPNPRIDLEHSPFYVNTELVAWPETGSPRRAGVSSFGLGGTNAHVVLEEAPWRPAPAPAPAEQLLVLSARTERALEAATDRLGQALREDPGVRLADVAFTLGAGRKAFAHRRALVASGVEDAATALEDRDPERVLSGACRDTGGRAVALLFTGYGDQYGDMTRGLYDAEAAYRDAIDRCAATLAPHLDRDLRDVLFDGTRRAEDPGAAPVDLRRMLAREPERTDGPLDRPLYGYPAVFAVEYAMAELFAHWGVVPGALLGHSLGEYVAACVAGVFTLEDALRLTVERARLIEGLGEGAMLGVGLPEESVRRYLGDGVDLAAVNTPRTCVLSGTPEAIERVRRDLAERDVACRRLHTRSAFHSHMMDPVVEPYAELLDRVPLGAPRTRFVSNVTGTWITPEQATDPAYWAAHLRATVRFSEGLETLWRTEGLALLEVGPGQTLSSTALQHPACADVVDRVALSSVPHRFANQPDRSFLLRTVGQLWLAGVRVDWTALHGGSARKVGLPTYPFERRRYWLDRTAATEPAGTARPRRLGDPSTWFSVPSWQRLPGALGGSVAPDGERWVVFAHERGIGHELAERLRATGAPTVTVTPGERWAQDAPDRFTIAAGDAEHYRRLVEALRSGPGLPERLVHCWSAGEDAAADAGVETVLDHGFRSLLWWAQASEPELMTTPARWDVVASGLYAVTGDEPLCPAKAALQGICNVAPQEYPGLRCRLIDVAAPVAAGPVADLLAAELAAADAEAVVALRGAYRWRPAFEAVPLAPCRPTRLRQGGVYMITGGLGKIGLVLARLLARTVKARLVLVGRTPLPPAERRHDGAHPPATEARIRAVAELEALGAEVVVRSADVSDAAALRAVVDEAVERFGALDGVIHAAGTVGPRAHRVLSDVGADEADWHFRPKVAGTYALARALEGREPAFVVLCSSVAAILGGLGFGAYAAANAFLDAFAHAQRQRGLPWTSVDWEAWRFPGDDGAGEGIGAALQDVAIDPDEGAAVFERLMTVDLPGQVVVSTTDLAARARLWSHPLDAAPAGPPRHARPNLRNAYVSPGTELERQVAAIWQDLLGVEEVGVHDNFFELGGSSLLGIQVVHRLRRDLRLAVPLTIVYEGPTISTLARLIAAADHGQAG